MKSCTAALHRPQALIGRAVYPLGPLQGPPLTVAKFPPQLAVQQHVCTPVLHDEQASKPHCMMQLRSGQR